MRLHLGTLIIVFIVGGCGVDFVTYPPKEQLDNEALQYEWPIGWGELTEGAEGSGGRLTQLGVNGSKKTAQPGTQLSTEAAWVEYQPDQQSGSQPQQQPPNANNNNNNNNNNDPGVDGPTDYSPSGSTTPSGSGTTAGSSAAEPWADYSPGGQPAAGSDLAPAGELFGFGDVPKVGDFRTQTQGGWGTEASGDNPGVYRDQNFDDVFAAGLQLGCETGWKLVLTSSVAVATFLPQGTQPGVLSSSWIDPSGTTLGGVFAGQVVALALNVAFDLADPAFGASAVALQDLVLVGTPCAGMTVEQVLGLSNDVLGGCNATDPAILNVCVTAINEAFVDAQKTSSLIRFPS